MACETLRRRAVHEEALFVWTAMHQGARHADEKIEVDRVTLSMKNAGDSTHVSDSM